MILSRRENRFFDVARAVSKTSDFHGRKMGCCVVYGKNILSVASNSEKTHSLQKTYNKYRGFDPETNANKLHAEVHALSLISKKFTDWANVEIYIYREWKSGKPALSKPCIACQKLIEDLGIKTIYYIDEHGQRIKEKI